MLAREHLPVYQIFFFPFSSSFLFSSFSFLSTKLPSSFTSDHMSFAHKTQPLQSPAAGELTPRSLAGDNQRRGCGSSPKCYVFLSIFCIFRRHPVSFPGSEIRVETHSQRFTKPYLSCPLTRSR